MPEKVYNVAFRIASGNPDIKKIESCMNGIGNWIRLNAYIWYVSTSLPGLQIYKRLEPTITKADSIVIVVVDPSDFQGFAPKWVWDWFTSKNRARGIEQIDISAQGIGLGRRSF